MRRLIALTVLLCALSAFAQVTTTPNAQLQLPAYGAQNWHIPWYYNFQLIDGYLGGTKPFSSGMLLGTSGTQPACGAANRGLLWTVYGTSDAAQQCQQTSTGVFGWRPIGGGSSITIAVNGVNVVPSGGVVNFLNGTNCTLTPSGNTVTVSCTGAGSLSSGASLPGTCTSGAAFVLTGSSGGMCACTANNTWTCAGNSGSLTAYSSTPQMDGVASAGVSTSYSRGDHRHGTDTSRAATGTCPTNQFATAAGSSSLTCAQPAASQVIGLATVATSGSYNDLSGKPALGTAAAQNSTAFLVDPGSNGIVKRTAAGSSASAGSSDITNALGFTPLNPANELVEFGTDRQPLFNLGGFLDPGSAGIVYRGSGPGATRTATGSDIVYALGYAPLGDPGASGIPFRTTAGVSRATTASDINNILGYTPASAANVAGSVVTVMADNTGATDVSSAVQAALTRVYNQGGGTLVFPAGTFLIGSQIAIPNDGGQGICSTASESLCPTHPAIKLQCAGGNFSLMGVAPTGGTVLNLTYSGSVAKITDFAFGTLEITGCTFTETGATTTTPFIMATNATLLLHDNFVSGYVGKTGTQNDQDFLIMGGTGAGTTNDSTGWFQGYGGYITHNFAQHIRRFAYLQSAANSIPITENSIFFTAGSNLAGGAAIEVGNASLTNNARGNIIYNNLIESAFYPYPVRVSNGAGNVLQNQFWDCSATGAVTTALYDFESGSGGNQVYSGFSDSGCPSLYRDVSPAPGQMLYSMGSFGATVTTSGTGGPTANLGTINGMDVWARGVSTRTSSDGKGVMTRWNNTNGNSNLWQGELFAYDYTGSAYKTLAIDGNPLKLNAGSGQQTQIGGNLFVTGMSSNPASGVGLVMRYNSTKGQIFPYDFGASYKQFDLDGSPLNLNANNTGGLVNINAATYHSQSIYSSGVGSLPSTGTYLTMRYNTSSSEGEIFSYNYANSTAMPTAINKFLLGTGGTPGTLGFNGYTNYGLAFDSNTGLLIQHAGSTIAGTRSNALEVNAGASVAWSASSYGATMDTGLSRSAAGVVSVGNGTPNDASGDIKAAHLQATLNTPSSLSASCTAGQIWADTNYVYVCTASGTIRRAALSDAASSFLSTSANLSDLTSASTARANLDVNVAPCELHFGQANASVVLGTGDGETVSCMNMHANQTTVASVKCISDGSVTINVLLTGGASALSAPCTCSTTMTACTLSSPVLQVPSQGTLDVPVTAVDGTAKRVVVYIKETI